MRGTGRFNVGTIVRRRAALLNPITDIATWQQKSHDDNCMLPEALVAAATPDLPAPRHLWQSRDVAPRVAKFGLSTVTVTLGQYGCRKGPNALKDQVCCRCSSVLHLHGDLVPMMATRTRITVHCTWGSLIQNAQSWSEAKNLHRSTRSILASLLCTCRCLPPMGLLFHFGSL